MIFRQLFEPVSSTYTYLLGCEETRQALLIDAVLPSWQRDLEELNTLGLKLAYTLDTHIHADHISAARKLKMEVGNRIAIAGVTGRGPAKSADLRAGDVIMSVNGTDIRSLAGFFRRVWSLGEAGVEVPISVNREGRTIDVRVRSGDRRRFLKGPVLH